MCSGLSPMSSPRGLIERDRRLLSEEGGRGTHGNPLVHTPRNKAPSSIRYSKHMRHGFPLQKKTSCLDEGERQGVPIPPHTAAVGQPLALIFPPWLNSQAAVIMHRGESCTAGLQDVPYPLRCIYWPGPPAPRCTLPC